jgi:hypothetical protein
VHGRRGSGAEPARELVACAERTLAAPGARIELHREFSWPQAQWPRPRGWRGKVLRLAAKGGGLLVSTGWTLATRRLGTTRGQEFGHLIGEGVAEPARGRYMVDFGAFAELHAGGTTYGGRAGRTVQLMRPMPDLGQAEEVLWLLRLLPGVTDAAVEGTDTLHGTACRRLAAHVDMQQASAATEEGLRPPPVERFEQLRALPLTVWIDGQHVRRIRFEHGAPARHRTTLELWEAGVPVGNLNWSRLPAFRSPGYEQEPRPWSQRVLRRRSRARGSGAARSPR